MIDNLLLGLSEAGTWMNLGFCFIGVMLGTVIGILPGLGPVATMSILLPITFGLPAPTALIMLAGIYYGAQYGGSTTAILVNLPGEASSVITAIDGYKMALSGRAGAALAIAALGSFFAGTVSTMLIAALGPLLTKLAQVFWPTEYFSLMVLGLVCCTILAHGSVIKSIGMTFLGLALGTVGSDVTSGYLRFTFGFIDLSDGLDFVTVATGLFGIAEILRNLENPERRSIVTQRISRLWPSKTEFAQAWPAVVRGTAIGSILGTLPGGGATLSSFASYTLEKKLSAHPEKFGKGAIEGVAGPESANNAGAQAAFIPLLSLGIPSNAVMAVMIGALMIQGIAPGPMVMSQQPALFWGLIVSMWIGNAMLLVINLPMVGLWVRLLKVPYDLLYPVVLIFCCIGVYTISNNTFFIIVMACFALGGYILLKLECELAPLLLSFVLSPLIEENLRRALLLSRGDPMTFVTRPISLGLLIAAVLLLAMVCLPYINRTREKAFAE